MATNCPEWLTKEFLEKCLKNEEVFSKININSFEVSDGVPAGNNCGSNLLRVKLEITTQDDNKIETFSIIVKAPITSGAMGELLLDESKDCEPIFYNEFIPQCNKLLKHSFAPKSFKSPLPSVVILEDLKLNKFLMADRVKQLDFEHCKLYMHAVAIFHAVSYTLCKENATLINRFAYNKLYDNNNKSADLFRITNKYMIESMANHIKNKEQAEIIRKCSTTLWDMLVESHKPSSLLNTFNHGDPWTTNMMFKYDEKGKVCDVKLIDFQSTLYGSPAHDVVYFLWSSANHEVRQNRLNDLYCIYVDAFNDNLRKLNCTGSISHDQFMVEVRNLSSLVIVVVGWNACILKPSPPDIPAIFAAVSKEGDSLKENPFDPYYTESFCGTHLKEVMEDLENHGVLKYLAEEMEANGEYDCS